MLGDKQKNGFFVFELQHLIDSPLNLTLSGRAADLRIIYGSVLTLTLPREINCQICTPRTDKSEVTAVIRAERLGVLTRRYIIISNNRGGATSPVRRMLHLGPSHQKLAKKQKAGRCVRDLWFGLFIPYFKLKHSIFTPPYLGKVVSL